MSVDAGAPSEAFVSDSVEGGLRQSVSGVPDRAVIVLLCLIEVVWIAALIDGAVRVVDSFVI